MSAVYWQLQYENRAVTSVLTLKYVNVYKIVSKLFK